MLIWMAVLIAGIAALAAVPAANIGAVRDGFGVIGDQAGPGVVAATHLYDDLADMDGQAATMLVLGDGTGFAETRSGAYQAYEKDQADANRQLESLGSGIDAIPGGPAAYIAVENGLSQYSQQVAQAIYIDGQAHGQPPAMPPADALARYQAATGLMHRADTGVLAEAQALIAGGQSTVDAAYYGAFGTIGQLRIWGIALTVLVVVALLVVQRKLGRRFKRRVNPPLLLATVLSLIFGVLMFSALDATHSSYVTQKTDAFDSVVALWQGRAVAADMSAAEARWLLDRMSSTTASQVGADTEESLFDTEEAQVLARPGVLESGYAYNQDLDAAVRSFMSQINEPGVPTPILPFTKGYLGAELGNVTFPAEQLAANAALQAYDAVIDDDAEFRGVVGTSADASTAVRYLTGTFDRDFATFSTDLDATNVIDEQQFTVATAHGGAGLGPWLWMPEGWALLTAALVLLGFLPRLREYRRS
jgi:hypothetical protein